MFNNNETPLFVSIYFWGLEGSLCGAQIPQKVPGYIQSSYCKFIDYNYKNFSLLLIMFNNYTVIIRLNSNIFFLSKILTIWWIDIKKKYFYILILYYYLYYYDIYLYFKSLMA